MGLLQSRSVRNAVRVSKEIDKQIRREAHSLHVAPSVLVLGQNDTMLRQVALQLKALCSKDNLHETLQKYRCEVYDNIRQLILAITDEMKEFDIDYEDSERSSDADLVLTSSVMNFGSSEIAESLKRLWKDRGIQRCLEQMKMSREYEFIHSAEHYFNNLDRICCTDFVPDTQDVFKLELCRRRFQEIHFNSGGYGYTRFIVPGSICSKKIIERCLYSVTAVVYCISLSEYDKFDLSNKNKLLRNLDLIKQISKSDVPVILLFTEKDVFEEKITHTPLTVCFEEYVGGNNYVEASKYIEERFQSALVNEERDVSILQTHFINLFDTNLPRILYAATRDAILSATIRTIFDEN